MAAPSVILLSGGLVWSGLGARLDMVMRNEAIAVSGGRVLAVGSNRELRRQYPEAELIELGGRSVVPALVAPGRGENPWRAVLARLGEGAPSALTRAEALSEFTEGQAVTAEGPRRGRLDPGWASDLMVLSADYFTINERDIPGLHAELTLLDGRIAVSPLSQVLQAG